MDLTARLNATIDRALTENRIVGAVTIVRRHGDLLYESARGLADREADRPMTVDAIFRLSSLTKPIVATTILAMADAGLLGLDDVASEHLPYFTPRLPDGSVPVITIHQLLTHTAGLSGAVPSTPDETRDPHGFNRWNLPLDDNMARVAAMPLAFAPGTGWAYSQAIDVLGAIAARITGGSLGAAVDKFITGPLRMADTRFSVTDPARLAAAYGDHPDGPELMRDPHGVPSPRGDMTLFSPGRIFNSNAYHSGGGGMAGTARDYMLLLETIRSGGGDILRPETAKAALSNQTPQLAFSQAPGWQFSLLGAWLADPALAKSPAAIGTSRWGGIFGHTWFIDPQSGLSVVAMTNTGLEGCDGKYPLEIRDAIYAGL